jgi:hypothetical protein
MPTKIVTQLLKKAMSTGSIKLPESITLHDAVNCIIEDFQIDDGFLAQMTDVKFCEVLISHVIFVLNDDDDSETDGFDSYHTDESLDDDEMSDKEIDDEPDDPDQSDVLDQVAKLL